MKDLKSTVSTQGKYVTQILHNNYGQKRTFHSIDTSTIKQGEFTKFSTKDGRMIMVNTANTWIVEVFSEQESKRKAGDQVICKAGRGKEFVDIIAVNEGMYHVVGSSIDYRVKEDELESHGEQQQEEKPSKTPKSKLK